MKLDYHDFVIKNGKFIGKFEEMYQKCEDPWNIRDAMQKSYYYLLDVVKDKTPSSSILDISCGLGAFTKRIRERFPLSKIKAIDISKTAIKKAKALYPDIDFEQFDIMKKPLKEKYDIIFVSQLFWYVLPRIKETIENIKKSSKGIIVISQQFYQKGEQKYGLEIMKNTEDLIDLMGLPLIDLIETDRFKNHNAILVFKNEKRNNIAKVIKERHVK